MPAQKSAQRVNDDRAGVIVRPPAPTRHPSLITDITVEHGPVDLLGRFFLKADTSARQRGVALEFGTFEELLEVNARNRDSWKPITSMYDHRYCPQGLAPDRAFCIFGRERGGDVVATHAARFYDVADDATLTDLAASSRLFYDEPERMKLPGERCEVSAPIAHSIRGRILINGAVWYHPTYRKRELAKIIPRVSRSYAFTHWKIDYSMGLAVEGPTKGGVVDRVGYPHLEWDLRLFNSTAGTLRCCLAWMDAAELMEDLTSWLVRFDAQVDRGIVDRRAQQQG